MRRGKLLDFLMAAHAAEGIILRKYYVRETSYLLVVYTKEFGKIRGVIKGVRGPYPQFAGNFEVITKAKLLFYKKKKKLLDLITQCEATDYFLPVKKDIERLTYAHYFIELIDTVTGDYVPDEELYGILDESLRMLGSGSSPKRISRIFELKVLGEVGFSPQVAECVLCSGPIEKNVYFSAVSGGVLCAECARKDPSKVPISLGTAKFMHKIQNTDIRKTEHIKVSREVGKETERVLKNFVQFQVNRQIKSLKFLDKLHKVGVV